MQKLLKIISAPLLVASLLVVQFVAPLSVSAVNVFQSCSNKTAAQSSYCQQASAQTATQNSNPVIHFIAIAINIVSYVAGAAAIIVLIVSGLKFMLANGDSNAITTARNGILYALIGIVVVVMAQGFVIFVLNRIK